MRRRVLSIILLILIALPAGCDSNEAGDADAILLRVENISDADFSSVFVSFPGAEARFGSVASSQASEYQTVETAYRYGYIELDAKGETYRIQPIDFVGETPLENGRYTYKLDIEENRLSLAFKRD